MMKTFGQYVTDKTPDIKSQFIAEVEFGMPSKQCRNFGICRITPIGGEKPLQDFSNSQAVAIVTIFDQHIIELDFLRCTINATDYRMFFSKGSFLVEEDYDHSKRSGTPNQFTVLKGQYMVDENNSLIKVVCHV